MAALGKHDVSLAQATALTNLWSLASTVGGMQWLIWLLGVLSGVSRSSGSGGGQPMVFTHLVGALAAGASCRHKHDEGGQGGN